MDTFTVNNFALATNPEAQKAGANSDITKYEDRVVCTIGTSPQSGSTFSRLKYRLAEPYQRGDDFIIWQDFELPDDYYAKQNGMMRLLGLWNNPLNGRLALWIDSDGCTRLQTEDKNKKLASTWLWRGVPEQYPTGRHELSLHIILGSLIEVLIDGQVMASVDGDNMPYSDYMANQILFMFDGANSNTNSITATCYGIGAYPFVSTPPNPCDKLELDYLTAEVGLENATANLTEAFNKYKAEHSAFTDAFTKRNNALEAYNECKGMTNRNNVTYKE